MPAEVYTTSCGQVIFFKVVVALVLSIPDLMFLLLCLEAGSSSSSVEETSSLGVAGRVGSCLIPLATLLSNSAANSWSGSGDPGGLAHLPVAWVGQWLTEGASSSFSHYSAASTLPERTVILPVRASTDAKSASSFWETISFWSSHCVFYSQVYFCYCLPSSFSLPGSLY